MDLRSAADIARSVTKAFQEKKNIFDVIMLFTKRILALFFLRVIFKYGFRVVTGQGLALLPQSPHLKVI